MTIESIKITALWNDNEKTWFDMKANLSKVCHIRNKFVKQHDLFAMTFVRIYFSWQHSLPDETSLPIKTTREQYGVLVIHLTWRCIFIPLSPPISGWTINPSIRWHKWPRLVTIVLIWCSSLMLIITIKLALYREISRVNYQDVVLKWPLSIMNKTLYIVT